METVLSEEEFESEINKQKQCIIIAKNADKTKKIILFDNNNTSLQKNANFKKYLQSVKATDDKTSVICIIDNDIIIKNKLNNSGICRLIKKSVFLINVIKSGHIIHDYKILREDEKEVSFNFLRKTSSSLPLIKYDDPLSIWIDAKPGDILKLDRVSENTGKSTGYRLVV